jgi:hypothetical protein
VLEIPNPVMFGLAVGLWMRPLTLLEQDGFAGLETLKVSFTMQSPCCSPTLRSQLRTKIEAAAKEYIGSIKFPCKTVDIDWAGLQS